MYGIPKNKSTMLPGEEVKPPFETVADEAAEMMAYFQWAERITGKIPEMALAHHVPNGGHRHPAVAMKLKREGVKPGVPDIEIPVSRRGFTGLHIEMKKTKGGKVSVEQRAFMLALMESGRLCFVARGWDVAKAVTDWYFGFGEFPGESDRK